MSSFTISKEDYIKAAGLMYRYESVKRTPHGYFLSIVYKMFVRCYELNLESVNEQYDCYEQSDTDEYIEVFEEYKKIGKRLYFSNIKRKLTNSLWHFFCSALYQTENEKMATEMRSWFFICVHKLYESDIEQSAPWWGEINIGELAGKEAVI